MASISNVPSGALAYVPGQTAKVSSTPTQSASNGGAQSGNSVQISAQAQQLSKWDSLSKAEQRALYDTTMDAFLALDRSYAMPGRPALQDLPDSNDPDRIDLAVATLQGRSDRSGP